MVHRDQSIPFHNTATCGIHTHLYRIHIERETHAHDLLFTTGQRFFVEAGPQIDDNMFTNAVDHQHLCNIDHDLFLCITQSL